VKNQIVLMLWHAGDARNKADELEKHGYSVVAYSALTPAILRLLIDQPPDLFLIDLNRLPSQGRDLAIQLRQRKPTRNIPIVFIRGQPGKTDRIQTLLPDACFTDWSEILKFINRIINTPVIDPVVPGTMDSYSGVPLSKKLGIKNGDTLILYNAPEDFESCLDPLPDSVSIIYKLQGTGDVVLLFSECLAELETGFEKILEKTNSPKKLWLTWPKKASGAETDLNQRIVRKFGLDAGWVDYKICSIDSRWSGLCFTLRKNRKL